MKVIYKTIENNGLILLFFTFILINIIKCIIFENQIGNKVSTQFLVDFPPKIVILILIGSPILVLNKTGKWYAIIVSLIIDFWIVANFMYFRNNGFIIDALALSMVGNMSGFWSSALLFFNFKIDIQPFLLTCLLIPFCLIKYNKKKFFLFIIALLSLYPLSFVSYYIDTKEKQYWNPKLTIEPTNLKKIFRFNELTKDETAMHVAFRIEECSSSIIHTLINELVVLKELKKTKKTNLSNDEIEFLNNKGYNSDITELKKFKSKLVIILVESMENWVLNENIMPNLCSFMQNHNYLYIPKIKSQIRQGGSSDGQMIINTGLLPLYNGAACYLYPNNNYPSICKLAEGKSLCMVPHKLDVWNQIGMSAAYGYTDNITLGEDDEILFKELSNYIEGGKYQIIQLLTMSTHANFESFAWKSKLSPDPAMPIYEQNYLKSFHYVDEHMGNFLHKIDSCEAFKNLTVIITGDHTIFPDDKRTEMEKYSKSNNNIYNPEAYTSAIIFSNKLSNKNIINDICYQMDIYPTITSLLECGYTNFCGVGKNLLDSSTKNNRDINYSNELKISNLIISSDYFSSK